MSGRIQKIITFLAADSILIGIAMVLSFLLRFDGQIPQDYQPNLVYYIVLSLAISLPLLYWRKLYAFTWMYVSLSEMVELFNVAVVSSLLFYLIYTFFPKSNIFLGFPRSIIVLHYALVFLFLGALRAAKRIAFMILDRSGRHDQETQALVIGANESAEELIRILRKGKQGQHPVAILDDDSEKHSTLLHGVKVLGSISLLPSVVSNYGIKSVIIALPEASRKTIQRIVALAQEANVTDIKIIPNLYELVNNKLGPENLREVRVEDLLGRKVAHIETQEISNFIKSKRILITGAAGSIGSELCRQVSQFAPGKLFLLDYEESNLFILSHMLEADYPSLDIQSIIADVRHEKKLAYLIKKIEPHVIFHAAAYKHVPLMEEYPEEAVMTNVFGTLNAAKAAIQANVQKFILISTDKAVRPISTMGKTKKLAEMIVQTFNERNITQFISVRFGNVLGSRGSVLPLFQEQLKRRLPLTVTDARMARYFMTAPEACLLVLEAAASGEGGEIFVLDMGKPVRITQLAKQLIRLSGLKPNRDIPIIYTKPRPGEKLFEDIFSDQENMIATRYQKIFKTKTTHDVQSKTFLARIEDLKSHIENSSELLKYLGVLIK